jgi:hypothetical protein
VLKLLVGWMSSTFLHDIPVVNAARPSKTYIFFIKIFF